MKLLDLFFAARPMLHLPIWSIYLVSLFYHHQLSHEHFGWANVGLFIGLSLLASGAYFLNQIYDYDSDRINRKLGFLHLGFLTKIEMMVIYLMVSLVAIGWALLGSVSSIVCSWVHLLRTAVEAQGQTFGRSGSERLCLRLSDTVYSHAGIDPSQCWHASLG